MRHDLDPRHHHRHHRFAKAPGRVAAGVTTILASVAFVFVATPWLLGCGGAQKSRMMRAPSMPTPMSGQMAADAAPMPGSAAPAVRSAPRAGARATARPTARSTSARGGVAKGTKTGPQKTKQVFQGTSTQIEQMLIYTGQLDLRVDGKAIPMFIDQVVETAAKLGGYIQRQDNTSVTVRVPSARFREALTAIGKFGEVINRSIEVQDVSEEYYDLGVRLQSLKATRKRLEEFLKRAKNIQEVLRLEQELSRLAGEIDRIEGRMRFLSARATFSTITVRFTPRPEPQGMVKPPPPPPPPAPKPRTIPLPIDWLQSVGIDSLLQLR